MKLLRFDRSGQVSEAEATLELGVLRVDIRQGYQARSEAICEMVWRPVFGLLSPRRRKIVAVRLGDAAPLHPLKGSAESYVDRPVTEEELEETEDAAFRLKEAEMEGSGSTVKPWAERALAWTLLGELLIVAVLAVMKGLPNAIEQMKGVTG